MWFTFSHDACVGVSFVAIVWSALQFLALFLFMFYRWCRSRQLEFREGREVPADASADSDDTCSLRQSGCVSSKVGWCILRGFTLYQLVGYVWIVAGSGLSYLVDENNGPIKGTWEDFCTAWCAVFTVVHAQAFLFCFFWEGMRVQLMLPVDDLSVATHVLMDETVPELMDSSVKDPEVSSSVIGTVWRVVTESFSSKTRRSLLLIERSTDRPPCVEYCCIMYVLDSETGMLVRAGTEQLGAAGALERFHNGGLTQAQADVRLRSAGANLVRVPVPGLGQALMNELSDFSYIMNSVGTWSFMINSLWNVAAMWVAITFFSSAFRAWFIVRPALKEVATMAALSGRCLVLRDGLWASTSVENIAVGDVLQVKGGNATVPCDGAVIEGTVVVDESMLTGEPMPVQKMQVEDSITKKNLAYAGTRCLQSTGPADDQAVLVVTATGALTTRGWMIRSVLFPADVRFKAQDQMALVYGIMLCVVTVVCIVDYKFSSFKSFVAEYLGAASNIAFLINPMLTISLTMGQSVAAKRLKGKHDITVLQPGRIPIAGKISTIIFDKTGTITREGMDLRFFLGVEDAAFMKHIDFDTEDPESAANRTKISEQLPDNLQRAIGSCHGCTTLDDGTMVGNMLDVSMCRTSGWTVCSDGLRSPDGSEHVEVVRKLNFDHNRMTSGVVVRSSNCDQFEVFIKGSYEKIQSISTESSVPTDYVEMTQKASKNEFYTLGFATRTLPPGVTTDGVRVMERDQLERGLNLCGLLLFRNEIKRDSEAAIAELTSGGIRSVMCTGDNALTGISVGRTCGIVTSEQCLLGRMDERGELVWTDPDEDGTVSRTHYDPTSRALSSCQLAVTPLEWHYLASHPDALEKIWWRLVVFARMRPDDKVSVVRFFQGRDMVVGMCGDGGNDCGGLRAAHAGLALSDSEASMVAPFSSSRDGKSLNAMVDLVREGRACLVTNLSTYTYFMSYSLILAFMRNFVGCYMSGNFGELYWLLQDITIGVVVVYTMTLSKPSQKLAPFRPTASLLGPRTVVAVCFPPLLIISVYFVLAKVMWSSDWYTHYDPIRDLGLQGKYWALRGDNYDSELMVFLMVVGYVSVAFANSLGGSHRRNVLYNRPLTVIYIAFLVGVFYLLLSSPSQVGCLLRVNCDLEKSLQTGRFGFIKYLAGSTMGACFMGPQNVVWKTAGDPQTWVPDKWSEPPCLPPQSVLDEIPVSDKRISQHGGVGPNNVYPSDFKWLLALSLAIIAVLINLFSLVVTEGFLASVMRSMRPGGSWPWLPSVVRPPCNCAGLATAEPMLFDDAMEMGEAE